MNLVLTGNTVKSVKENRDGCSKSDAFRTPKLDNWSANEHLWEETIIFLFLVLLKLRVKYMLVKRRTVFILNQFICHWNKFWELLASSDLESGQSKENFIFEWNVFCFTERTRKSLGSFKSRNKSIA